MILGPGLPFLQEARAFCYILFTMEYLFTLTDKDIFPRPEFPKPDAYKKRMAVKAVVTSDEGKYAFVTNPVHGFILLPGGGAETEDLFKEIERECAEEIALEITVLKKIGIAHEIRNRDGKEYETVCFLAKAGKKLESDARTEDEKKNDLHVVWLDEKEALKILGEQQEKVNRGGVEFYNTAFNIVRDLRFFTEYLRFR